MMQRVLACLVVLAWGLWFGGLLTLFIAVQSVFRTFDPDRVLAGKVASGIFHRFEVYQIALAAAALLATIAWRILSGPSRSKGAILGFFVLTAALAISSTTMITPMIETLRLNGEANTDRFRSLHGVSMMFYMGEAVFLLIVGLILPTAIYRDRFAKVKSIEHETELDEPHVMNAGSPEVG